MITDFELIAQKVLNKEWTGKFVLRNGKEIPSDQLSIDFESTSLDHRYPYMLGFSLYASNGNYWCNEEAEPGLTSDLDIVNWLPNQTKERYVQVQLEKAREWYKQGGELRDIALQAYSEDELTYNTIDEEIKEHAKLVVSGFSVRNGYVTTEELLVRMGQFVKNLMLDRYKLQENENI